MNIEERIKEIEKQIEELNAEKKRLRGENIAGMVNRLILAQRYGENKAIRPTYATEIWQPIMSLAKEIHNPNRPKHRKRILVKDLTEDQKKISADMATELVDVWNKYFTQLYGEKQNETDN